MDELLRQSNCNIVESIAPDFRKFTAARLAIGRSGGSLRTSEILDFDLAHAQAKDAVWSAFDADQLLDSLTRLFSQHQLSCHIVKVKSCASHRSMYLKRPDLGRRLHADSISILKNLPKGSGITLIISDGLSAQATHQHAEELIHQFLLISQSQKLPWQLDHILIVPFARVAISDQIGDLIQCRATAMLLGERPGLSTPDSLGVYFTLDPKSGRMDADRNCISNIHSQGLSANDAARQLHFLIETSIKTGLGGVRLSEILAEKSLNSQT
ncbi:MAG: hypothetical protein RJA81_131 [Planctomycetota bacterium]|jgi:ethanolamine ammonia-lyase small subunit